METQVVECKLIDVMPVDKEVRSFNKEFAVDLAASIRVEGMYNPIAIRPNPDKPGHYFLVQGRHRLYATFKVLKEQSIRCTILDEMDETEHKMAAIAENLWRFDTSKAQRLKAVGAWHEYYLARLAATSQEEPAAPASATRGE